MTGGRNTPTDPPEDTTEFMDRYGSWTSGPNLPTPLARHNMALLDDHRVLILGGIFQNLTANLDQAWIYDHNNGGFSLASVPSVTNRINSMMSKIKLRDGTEVVVLVGGGGSQTQTWVSFNIFNEKDNFLIIMKSLTVVLSHYWKLLGRKS